MMGVIRIVSISNAALSVFVVAAVVVEGVSFVAKDFVAMVFIVVVVEGVSSVAKDVVFVVVVEGVSSVAKDVVVVVVEGVSSVAKDVVVVSFVAKDVSSSVVKDDSSIDTVVEGDSTIV